MNHYTKRVDQLVEYLVELGEKANIKVDFIGRIHFRDKYTDDYICGISLNRQTRLCEFLLTNQYDHDSGRIEKKD